MSSVISFLSFARSLETALDEEVVPVPVDVPECAPDCVAACVPDCVPDSVPDIAVRVPECVPGGVPVRLKEGRSVGRFDGALGRDGRPGCDGDKVGRLGGRDGSSGTGVGAVVLGKRGGTTTGGDIVWDDVDMLEDDENIGGVEGQTEDDVVSVSVIKSPVVDSWVDDDCCNFEDVVFVHVLEDAPRSDD